MKKKIIIASLLALLVIPLISLANFKPATLIKDGHRVKVTSSTQAAELFAQGYKLDQKLGYAVVTDFGPRLATSMTSVQNTVPVTSMTTKDGHVLTMADLGSVVYLTIEPGASKEEIVACTSITTTTVAFAGCTRGLAFYGTSTASVAANQYSHQSGSSVILTNSHYVYQQFVDRDSAQTVGGVKTFTSFPLATSTLSNNASNLTEFATVNYVNNVATSGAANMSETVKGIGEIATQAEAAAGTSVGGTSARLVLPASMATTTPSATTSIPVTGTNGKLSQSFLDLTQDFTFSGTSTFSGPTILSSIPTMSTSTSLSDNNVVSKYYVDQGESGKIIFASTTAVSTPMTTATNVYTIATYSFSPNMGVDDSLDISFVAHSNGGSGTNTWTFYISDGISSTSIASVGTVSTDPARFVKFKLVNRHSITSQFISMAVNGGNANVATTIGYGNLTMNTAGTITITATAVDSSQSSRTGVVEYLEVIKSKQ